MAATYFTEAGEQDVAGIRPAVRSASDERRSEAAAAAGKAGQNVSRCSVLFACLLPAAKAPP